MMKRLISLFLLLLLLASQASAETLREQVGAPESIQTVYYSNTRKTEVFVQADVIVPDIDHIDTYEVEARDMTVQDAMLIATACAPESDWADDWVRIADINSKERWQGDPDALYEYRVQENDDYYSEEACFLYNPLHTPKLEEIEDPYGATRIFNSKIETAFGIQTTMRRGHYRYTRGYNHPYFYNPITDMDISAPQEADRLKGQLMTWEEATNMALAFAKQLPDSFQLAYRGAMNGAITYYNEKTDTFRWGNSPYRAYAFCFVREVDGIPLTFTSRMDPTANGSNQDEQYASPPGKEYLYCIIDQERIVEASYENPIAIGDTLSKKVTLLPFEQIMDIFGQICPLTVQFLENENQVMGGVGNRWEINEIRLGYMPVLRKDGSGLWELRPVWDFIGVHSFAREYYDEAGLCALTIDAIDGTVIDRSYGY